MNNSSQSSQRWFIQTRNIIYYILGVIEVLLAFRLVFKLLGASAASPFVSFLYSLTRFFVAPFVGIFRALYTEGNTRFIFEPSTVIAMIVYALIARGIVSLVKLKAVNT